MYSTFFALTEQREYSLGPGDYGIIYNFGSFWWRVQWIRRFIIDSSGKIIIIDGAAKNIPEYPKFEPILKPATANEPSFIVGKIYRRWDAPCVVVVRPERYFVRTA